MTGRTLSSPARTAERPRESVVEVRDLHLSYGSTPVLRGVDLTVAAGEVVALLGPNGAGKTSTVEVLEGFRSPSGGQVRVLGQDPATADHHWRSRVGIVLQSWRDHGRWTARELLTHVARHYRPYDSPERRRPLPVQTVIDRVGLTDKADCLLQTLSGGQRRRVDVATGVLGDPDLLFLDEPTAGLDPEARRDFHDLIRRQVAESATSVLLTTHDLHEAESLADRVVILAGGRIIADGPPGSLGGTTVVRWTERGRRAQAELSPGEDGTAFIRELVADPTRDVADVHVTRSGLEETYLAMIGRTTRPATADTESGATA